jgi:hypothetical protein
VLLATAEPTNAGGDPDPLLALPDGVATLIGPLVAPAGTVAVICVSEFTVNVPAVPLNMTAVAPVNPLPLIVTVVPTGPLEGLKPVIDGAAAPKLADAGAPNITAITRSSTPKQRRRPHPTSVGVPSASARPLTPPTSR